MNMQPRNLLTGEELVARAAALQPVLAAHAAEVDRTRHLSPDVVDKIAEAGLLSLGVPRRYGGQEASLQTHLRVSAALGKGCGSTAWVVQILNSSAVVVGMFGKQAQDDVWGKDPSARIGGARPLGPTAVERVEGGWRIGGRWPWLSGVEQAQWAFLPFPLPSDTDHPDLGIALVPIAEGIVEETWFMVGMRGTASNTLVLDKAFVPDHRVSSAGRLLVGHTDTPFKNEIAYRLSFAVQTVLVLMGSQIGLAEAALDHVIAGANKAIAYSNFATQRASAGFHIQIGEAAVMISTARQLVLRAAAEADAAAEQGVLPEHGRRSHMRAEAAYAAKLLRDAVQILVDAHGASTFAESNALQRIWRDLNAAGRHGMLGTQLYYEVHGKTRLGLAEDIVPFI